MPTRQEWINIIHGRGGKVTDDFQGKHGYSLVGSDFASRNEWFDASWFYRNPGDQKFKAARDTTAREMRKDGWEIKSETNSLGYFFKAQRRKK